MTIPEAVMLVLQAGSIGKGGELFLLDMGKQVKISDLARNMIRLSGFVPDKDIKIEYIGLRPGEKLYEELLIDGEGIIDTAYEKIKVCNTCSRIDEEDLFGGIEHFILLVKNSGDSKTALKILERLIPDFKREDISESTTSSAEPYLSEEKGTNSFREI
jgi:FlaA1/EpsC-like NDP-sugar epimerase